MRLSKLLTLLCCVVACGMSLAADRTWEYEIGAHTGYDSNPLKLPEDEKSGGFLEAEFEGELEVELSKRNDFYLDLGADARRYGSSVSDADTTAAQAEAGFKLVPYKNGSRWLVLDLGTRLRVSRDTFTSRRTGEVFEVDDGAGGDVRIPDRFDYNRVEGFADVRWRLSSRTWLYLDTAFAQKNYTEDYDEIPTVESLDYDSLYFEAGTSVDLTDAVEIELSAFRNDRDYDERSALDEVGDEVLGTTREYRYTGFDGKLRLRPEAAWRWTLGLGTTDREDLHAGYYDYTSWTARVATSGGIGAKTRLYLSTAFTDKDYDNSTVNSEVDGELRSSETWRLRGVLTRQITRRFDVKLQTELRSVDNANPLYDYDRNSFGVWVAYH